MFKKAEQLESNGTHQLLVCFDNINLLGKIYPNEKHRSCIKCFKEYGQEVNTEKIEYIFMSYHQIKRQNHSSRAPNKSFGNVVKLKYLEMMVTNKIAFMRKL
jgi:hypothetical protein